MIDRRHPRLKAYDYRTAGAYFITICCEHREMWFGKIDGSGRHLSAYGRIAEQEIDLLLKRYAYIDIPNYVVMPNHLHLILMMHDGDESRLSIPQLIGVLKAQITGKCKDAGYPNRKLFQTSFHDHVIRTEQDYAEIWQYIEENPRIWAEDRLYRA